MRDQFEQFFLGFQSGEDLQRPLFFYFSFFITFVLQGFLVGIEVSDELFDSRQLRFSRRFHLGLRLCFCRGRGFFLSFGFLLFLLGQGLGFFLGHLLLVDHADLLVMGQAVEAGNDQQHTGRQVLFHQGFAGFGCPESDIDLFGPFLFGHIDKIAQVILKNGRGRHGNGVGMLGLQLFQGKGGILIQKVRGIVHSESDLLVADSDDLGLALEIFSTGLRISGRW